MLIFGGKLLFPALLNGRHLTLSVLQNPLLGRQLLQKFPTGNVGSITDAFQLVNAKQKISSVFADQSSGKSDCLDRKLARRKLIESQKRHFLNFS